MLCTASSFTALLITLIIAVVVFNDQHVHKKILHTLKYTLEIFYLLAVIIGFIYGVYEYNDQKKRKQIEETYSIIVDFYSQETYKAWLSYAEAISKGITPDVVQSDELWNAYVDSVLTQTGIDITIFLNFYKKMQFCVENHVCSKELTLKELGDEAEVFHNVFYEASMRYPKQHKALVWIVEQYRQHIKPANTDRNI